MESFEYMVADPTVCEITKNGEFSIKERFLSKPRPTDLIKGVEIKPHIMKNMHRAYKELFCKGCVQKDRKSQEFCHKLTSNPL